jgi:hypothetical protein
MSFRLVAAALLTGLPYRDQLVLVHLADHAADDGTSCRPSVDRLAKRCGMCRTAVMDATAALEVARWLVRVRIGKRVHYLIDAPRLVALADQTSRPRQPHQSPTATGSSHEPAREPSGARAPGLSRRAPEPDREPARDPDMGRWRDLVPWQREGFEAAARRLMASGVTDLDAYAQLRAACPRR